MSYLTQSDTTTADATAVGANLLVKTAGAAVVPTASTDIPLGATTGAVAASANFTYDFFGPTKLTAAGAIAKGALVMPTGSAGKIATRTGTNTIVGIALEAASGDGHVISVFLVPQGYASATPLAVGWSITVNAEAGNAVAVDLQAIDQDGNNVAAVIESVFTTYELTMIEAVAAEFTCAETGAGTIISTTANSRIHFQTDANGAAQVTITDVGADRTQDVPFTVEAVNLTNGTYISAGKQLDFATFA